MSGSRRRTVAAGVCAAALALALAVGCSDSDNRVMPARPARRAPGRQLRRYTTPLKGICPDTVVVQTSWWPEVSLGYTYQLLGPNPTIDKKANRVTGPLGGTGVTLEIRAGGPAVGFQPVSSVLAQDDDILFGYVDTDEAVQNSGSQPTVAVFASYEKTPLVFLWGDPAWNFADVADDRPVGRDGAGQPNETSTWTSSSGRGCWAPSQVDTSYQGSPDRFVAADGKIVQEGFVTNEPYRLEHDVKEWGKPVKYLLLADEYPVYSGRAVRPAGQAGGQQRLPVQARAAVPAGAA